MLRYLDVSISRRTEEKSCKVRYVHRACQDSKFAVLTVFATRMESIFWRYYELRETFNGGEEKFIKQQELQLIQCSFPETSKILARPREKRECLVLQDLARLRLNKQTNKQTRTVTLWTVQKVLYGERARHARSAHLPYKTL